MKKKVNYYRQHNANLLAEVPAEAFNGWGKKEIEIPIKETAFLIMHSWNYGISPKLEYGPNTRFKGLWNVVEYVPRAIEITKRVVGPLLEKVRSSKLTIIHVGSSENYCKNYPGYQKAKALSGDPSPILEGAVKKNWSKIKTVERCGEENLQNIQNAQKYVDFPNITRPRGNEWVVINSHQLNALCRRLKIWNLIYTGFAINWCLFESPAGMIDMSRLGYGCSTIKEAVTAVENDWTAREELCKKLALWKIAMSYGYVINLEDFLKALEGETK
ncbi:MAG: hypothetical protein ABIK53_00100 [bacterium]